jgi:hypothetical protein
MHKEVIESITEEDKVDKIDKEEKIDKEAENLLSALKKSKKIYIAALSVSSAIGLGAIISAVHFHVSFGVLLMALAVITYLAIVINMLYSIFGIAYSSYQGGMKITALYGKHREVIYIPDKIMLLTVTEIGDKAFTHESSKNIREIHLPKTLLKIGKSAFANLPALTDVYYEGSEAQWKKLSRLAPLEGVTLHFNSPIPRLEKKKKDKKVKNKKDKKSKNKTKAFTEVDSAQ